MHSHKKERTGAFAYLLWLPVSLPERLQPFNRNTVSCRSSSFVLGKKGSNLFRPYPSVLSDNFISSNQANRLTCHCKNCIKRDDDYLGNQRLHGRKGAMGREPGRRSAWGLRETTDFLVGAVCGCKKVLRLGDKKEKTPRLLGIDAGRKNEWNIWWLVLPANNCTTGKLDGKKTNLIVDHFFTLKCTNFRNQKRWLK